MLRRMFCALGPLRGDVVELPSVTASLLHERSAATLLGAHLISQSHGRIGEDVMVGAG